MPCLTVVRDLASSIGNVEVGVWLRDGDTNEMVLRGVRGCTKHQKGTRLEIGRQGMVGHVAATGKMRYAPDVDQDPYYIGCEPGTRSEVTIPLKADEKVIGVLSIDHDQFDAFSGDQLQVLQALAGHIAVAVENARLFRLERFERERLQKESDEARAMQRALFLKAQPLVPGFAFETAWHPAGSVAGDWFDFIDLGNQRVGIALADVSGKGMPGRPSYVGYTSSAALNRATVHFSGADTRASEQDAHRGFSYREVCHDGLRSTERGDA
jgi:sigma-B regulation protein RsbU (phosphoserine phosphatase)